MQEEVEEEEDVAVDHGTPNLFEMLKEERKKMSERRMKSVPSAY